MNASHTDIYSVHSSFFTETAPPEISTLSLHDALPICRPVERDLLAGADRGGAEFGLVGSGDDEQRSRDLEIAALPARLGYPPHQRRCGHLFEVALGREGMRENSVGDFARHLRHRLAHGRDE